MRRARNIALAGLTALALTSSLSLPSAPAGSGSPTSLPTLLSSRAWAAGVPGLPPGLQPLDRKRVPPPGPPPQIKLPSPRRFKLGSGAELLVIERHTLPMVAVAMVWKSGATAEAPGEAGLASLTAGLLDEGTERRGPLELAAALQGLGTGLEAASGWDSTALSMVTLGKNLDASLDLMAEVALHPAFAEREFQRVKGDAIAAAQQRRDSAQFIASEAFGGALYGAARMGLPQTGNAATLGRLTRDQVIAFYRQRLRANDATFIVAGDVGAEAVRGKLEARFGATLATAGAAPTASATPTMAAAPPSAPRRLVIDRAGAPQSEVRIGLPGPGRLTPDYFALQVMNEILGGGDFSNRLNLNLREAHAYTYGAHSGFAFHVEGGPFVVATAAKTAVTGPAIAEALGELARIRDAEVKPEELRFAKDSITRSLARRFETLQDLVFEVANKETFGLPDDHFATLAQKVEAVTAADVQRVARQHLDLARVSIVVVGDNAQVAPQLRAIAPQAGPFEGLAPPPTKH